MSQPFRRASTGHLAVFNIDTFVPDINELLSEMSFVDRIVFGKWNYNSKSTGYSDHKNFYSTKIEEVIKFGYFNEIEVYIKNDTLNLSDSN